MKDRDGRNTWDWDPDDSDQFNSICSLEMTLWNLGIDTMDVLNDKEDWPWHEVLRYVEERVSHGIIETWKTKSC